MFAALFAGSVIVSCCLLKKTTSLISLVPTWSLNHVPILDVSIRMFVVFVDSYLIIVGLCPMFVLG